MEKFVVELIWTFFFTNNIQEVYVVVSISFMCYLYTCMVYYTKGTTKKRELLTGKGKKTENYFKLTFSFLLNSTMITRTCLSNCNWFYFKKLLNIKIYCFKIKWKEDESKIKYCLVIVTVETVKSSSIYIPYNNLSIFDEHKYIKGLKTHGYVTYATIAINYLFSHDNRDIDILWT